MVQIVARRRFDSADIFPKAQPALSPRLAVVGAVPAIRAHARKVFASASSQPYTNARQHRYATALSDAEWSVMETLLQPLVTTCYVSCCEASPAGGNFEQVSKASYTISYTRFLRCQLAHPRQQFGRAPRREQRDPIDH